MRAIVVLSFVSASLLFAFFAECVADSNETITTTEIALEPTGNRNSSNTSGKTYFIQLKKSITSNVNNDNDKLYTKINHYKNFQDGGAFKEYQEDVKEEEFLRKKYHDLFNINVPENIREATVEDVKLLEKKRNPNRIDDEWILNTNRSIYDLPNITQDIYEAMLENNKHNTVINASTVKFFFERDTNLTSNIVQFNIESLVNSSDIIVDAELHVYRLPRVDNKTRINATENVVRLYQMTENPEDDDDYNSTTKPAPDVHKLANVIYISSSYEGWQVFKVKTVVENWRNGDDNLGFLISTVDTHDQEDSAVEFAHRERNGGKYQPTLVVYLDRQVAPNRKSALRRVRKPFRPIRRGDALPADPCRRHVWYLSFHELGWNNFVIAPSGFMAYRCAGSCRSPTASTFTNHGKLLSISERAGDALIPCCVPSNYKSVLIMFYDKESNVVIKEYEDMVVNGCGCR